MTNDTNFHALRPVCGSFLAPIWVCACLESAERASWLCLCTIRAIFRVVWATEPVCQAGTKYWASGNEPVEARPHVACFPTDVGRRDRSVGTARTDCRHWPRSNSSVLLAQGCAGTRVPRASLA